MGGATMNRRSFISRLAAGIAGFTILPSAGRIWKPTGLPPGWQTSLYELLRQRQREAPPDVIDMLTDRETAIFFQQKMREQFALAGLEIGSPIQIPTEDDIRKLYPPTSKELKSLLPP